MKEKTVDNFIEMLELRAKALELEKEINSEVDGICDSEKIQLTEVAEILFYKVKEKLDLTITEQRYEFEDKSVYNRYIYYKGLEILLHTYEK